MKNVFSFHSKMMTFLALLMVTCSFCPAFANEGAADCPSALRQLERRVGLLETANHFCGPVTIGQVHLGNQHSSLIVRPGQTVDCSLFYQFNASQQKFLNKHHLIVGLEGVAAEACIAHLYGVRGTKGTKHFKLVAPLQEGDYYVKAIYYASDKCEDAFNVWNVLKVEPSSSATIGILKVRQGF